MIIFIVKFTYLIIDIHLLIISKKLQEVHNDIISIIKFTYLVIYKLLFNIEHSNNVNVN